MSFRRATYALALAIIFAFPACKKRANVTQEPEEVSEERQEQEPNDTRDACDRLDADATLVGNLHASDIDAICPDNSFAVEVFAETDVSVALEDNRRQRVELGKAKGLDQALKVHLPGKDWAIILRGTGDWKITPIPTETLPEDEARFCGVRLGTESAPVVLGIQELPAVFSLCAEAKPGAAVVQFPPFVPANTQGFDLNIEGADEHTRGTVRVTSDGAEVVRSAIAPDKRLPSLRWYHQALMGADLLVSQTDASKTLFLRIDEVSAPESLNEYLELEPNETQEQAIAIPRPGTVAGTLYHRDDVDWFSIEPTAGDVQVEILAQQQTKLRIQSVYGEERNEALRGDDGIYRLCSVGEVDDAQRRFVRVAYASDAQASDGVYQMTLKPSQSELDPITLLADVKVPTNAPTGAFGFLPLAKEGDASSAPVGFGQQPTPDSSLAERKGRLYPPDVEHGWVFRIPDTNEDVHVEIELRGKSSMDLKLRVLDADGITIAQADRGAAGQEERLALELPAGYYVIAVKATGVKGCDGEYIVHLTSPDANKPEVGGASNSAPSKAEGTDTAPTHTGNQRPTEHGASPKEKETERGARGGSDKDSIPDYPW